MLISVKDYAIGKTVIDLAQNFSFKAVAEDAESIAIAERLAQMHCDILGGYVFDQPLPVEEFQREYRIQNF